MKIMSTIEPKGYIAFILDESEIATIISIAGEKPPVEEPKLPVIQKDPLKSMHTNNKEFIKEVFISYGENIIKLNDAVFVNLRKLYFVINLTCLLNNLKRNGVIDYNKGAKSFTFIKNPL
jgi:hypothetical protein